MAMNRILVLLILHVFTIVFATDCRYTKNIEKTFTPKHYYVYNTTQ